MRALYHFPQSPFSRRVRLGFAHKGLAVELRDARNDATVLAEALAFSPLGRIPVLVDGASVLTDSLAILQWLDAVQPDPPLWPRDPAPLAEALRVAVLVDGALDALVDCGTRLFELADHPAWAGVRDRALDRARGALEAIATLARGRGERPLVGDTWGAVDIVALTAALWLDGLPARAPTFPPAARIVALGVEAPEPLRTWAASHRGRPEVEALDRI